MTTASSTAAVASASPSSTCTVSLYEIPTSDAACAMPYGSNHTSIMTACCKGAAVVSYYNDCGLYCLAQGQDVAQLTSCLYQGGAAWQDVFCEGNSTATATQTGTGTLATSAGASVVATGGSVKGLASGTLTGSSSLASSTVSQHSAASGRGSTSGKRKAWLAVGSVLIVSICIGIFA